MNEFKHFESAAWERKAFAYNDTWGTVTSQPIEAVLNAAGIQAGTTLLDCGCGPGHLCHQASLRKAVVTGCDYSGKMIEIAQALYPHIDFRHGDAEALPFESCCFDVVVMNYLLLHVPDQRRVLQEAWRVLKPEGQLIYTMWCAPEESPGLSLIFKPLKQYADMSVIPPAEDIFMFSCPDKAKDFLSTHGFCDVSTQRFETAWHLHNAEMFFEAVQAGTRMGGLIELQQSDIKHKIENSVLNDIQRFRLGERFKIPTPSIIVSACKI